MLLPAQASGLFVCHKVLGTFSIYSGAFYILYYLIIELKMPKKNQLRRKNINLLLSNLKTTNFVYIVYDTTTTMLYCWDEILTPSDVIYYTVNALFVVCTCRVSYLMWTGCAQQCLLSPTVKKKKIK